MSKIYYDKVLKSYALYNASIEHLKEIDIKKLKTAYELEPLDAFNSRFERLIELIISQLSKTIELEETGINEGTIKDRLNLLEKIGYISDINLWLEMRGVRNKLAHEYIENSIYELYYMIIKDYNSEINLFIDKIKKGRQKN